MAMTDEDRLYELFRTSTLNRWLTKDEFATLVDTLRVRGVTITPPPAPEPVVELPPLTCKQVDMLFAAIQGVERWEIREEGFDAWFELNALVNRARCLPEPQP